MNVNGVEYIELEEHNRIVGRLQSILTQAHLGDITDLEYLDKCRLMGHSVRELIVIAEVLRDTGIDPHKAYNFIEIGFQRAQMEFEAYMKEAMQNSMGKGGYEWKQAEILAADKKNI